MVRAVEFGRLLFEAPSLQEPTARLLLLKEDLTTLWKRLGEPEVPDTPSTAPTTHPKWFLWLHETSVKALRS
eukprot:8049868-Pyramimonas_sp.AAC.1